MCLNLSYLGLGVKKQPINEKSCIFKSENFKYDLNFENQVLQVKASKQRLLDTPKLIPVS